jgi:LemA protein
MILILWIALGAFLLLVVILYNSLVGKKNRVDQAFGGVDAQLKKRHDLIPNLVAAVKGYMGHEKSTLVEVTELRAKALSASLPPDQKIALEGQLSQALRGLMVSVESYPELKASENFNQLQRALNEVEEQLSAARRSYNAAVTDYNNGIEMFPGSLLAGALGWARKSVFQAEEAERRTPDVGKLLG